MILFAWTSLEICRQTELKWTKKQQQPNKNKTIKSLQSHESFKFMYI